MCDNCKLCVCAYIKSFFYSFGHSQKYTRHNGGFGGGMCAICTLYFDGVYVLFDT